jgi:hypothetical protein
MRRRRRSRKQEVSRSTEGEIHMGCDFPEHHGSGGGSWWPLVVAVIVAALFASVIGTVIHILAMVMTFVGIAALASGGGWLWWRLSHRPQRQLQMQYQPQMTSRWGRPGLPQDQAQPIEQHVHHHWHGISAEDVAAVVRRQREHE